MESTITKETNFAFFNISATLLGAGAAAVALSLFSFAGSGESEGVDIMLYGDEDVPDIGSGVRIVKAALPGLGVAFALGQLRLGLEEVVLKSLL
mmetsp:Transcript_4473/g.5647  ORF Transcript_4473/g.5647 Transcript_4473/m.5647 type:complete len:94 (-) Transcript_4473:470-751(-)|eukprot:CAMPEP_0204860220 /NCGR_PEP_ID=MMETSP1347-20130617/24180_1 /ASSEMBLY_ACC=CAM_ASM_000690 /TAXON_ID=215587 /ORGANISM="Aplanochytrium stocchinoi, Strain GSBS06" /LENGTH=93 /DNA_ID=CAMNT_0052008877 /DNA_START=829 /DNA_END=1110 /DNA_ORIENTATION=+